MPAALAAALLTACAAARPRLEAGAWPLPSVADSPFVEARWQQLRLERDGRSLDLLAVLEPLEGGLQLAGLTPDGRRLLTLRWDALGFSADRSPGVPDFVDPGLVLRDLVLAHWPAESLRRALAGSAWDLEEDAAGGRRLLWYGRLHLELRPEPGGRRLLHPLEGYSVVVRDLEEDPEQELETPPSSVPRFPGAADDDD
jgi:hypothetical protein